MISFLTSIIHHEWVHNLETRNIKNARRLMIKRFEKKHSSTISIFNVGDNVSIKILEGDRNSTDPLRLPCAILNASGGMLKHIKYCPGMVLLIRNTEQVICNY